MSTNVRGNRNIANEQQQTINGIFCPNSVVVARNGNITNEQ